VLQHHYEDWSNELTISSICCGKDIRKETGNFCTGIIEGLVAFAKKSWATPYFEGKM